jgi:hypothetical protein
MNDSTSKIKSFLRLNACLQIGVEKIMETIGSATLTPIVKNVNIRPVIPSLSMDEP